MTNDFSTNTQKHFDGESVENGIGNMRHPYTNHEPYSLYRN